MNTRVNNAEMLERLNAFLNKKRTEDPIPSSLIIENVAKGAFDLSKSNGNRGTFYGFGLRIKSRNNGGVFHLRAESTDVSLRESFEVLLRKEGKLVKITETLEPIVAESRLAHRIVDAYMHRFNSNPKSTMAKILRQIEPVISQSGNAVVTISA